MSEQQRMVQHALVPGVPSHRDHIDCNGSKHRFMHVARELPEGGGWALEAIEVDPAVAPGYRLRSKVSATVYIAYLDLLQKIEDAMSRKHLVWGDDEVPDLLDGTLRGRVVNGGLVIDGRLLTFDKLVKLLNMHEGFPIALAVERWSD